MGVPIKITLRGKTLYLCCKGCIAKAKRAPVETLKKLEGIIELRPVRQPRVRGVRDMIERIIEFSVRHRFLVLLIGLGVVVWGIYAVVNTPIDAIPDLSENQVIVFTDWMGQAPRRSKTRSPAPCRGTCKGWRA